MITRARSVRRVRQTGVHRSRNAISRRDGSRREIVQSRGDRSFATRNEKLRLVGFERSLTKLETRFATPAERILLSNSNLNDCFRTFHSGACYDDRSRVLGTLTRYSSSLR